VTGSTVRTGRDGDIDVVVLDSVANRNALSLALMSGLVDAVDASASGDGRALVLDHTGAVFCPGVDLKERLASGDDRHSRLFADVLRTLWRYPKPIVARVAGAARGGGMAMLSCCDVVVASSAASFAYSEVRVGVAPALVLAVTASKVGVGPLLPWMLTGDAFDPAEAQRLGLVHRVAGDADASLRPECDALRAAAPGALVATKQLARRLTGDGGLDALDAMEAVSVELFRTAEAAEGMAAFAERRPPSFANAH
jgi:enoyl-CoA hydratase/carnithine racemase